MGVYNPPAIPPPQPSRPEKLVGGALLNLCSNLIANKLSVSWGWILVLLVLGAAPFLWEFRKTERALRQRNSIRQEFGKNPISMLLICLLLIIVTSSTAITGWKTYKSRPKQQDAGHDVVTELPQQQQILPTPAAGIPSAQVATKPSEHHQSKQGRPTQVTSGDTITADHGIAIGGNAHVENPTVNNFAPPAVKISVSQAESIATSLRSVPGLAGSVNIYYEYAAQGGKESADNLSAALRTVGIESKSQGSYILGGCDDDQPLPGLSFGCVSAQTNSLAVAIGNALIAAKVVSPPIRASRNINPNDPLSIVIRKP